jgi:hypothetical protein
LLAVTHRFKKSALNSIGSPSRSLPCVLLLFIP